MTSTCRLCALPLPKHAVAGSYCCHGCQAVHQILNARGVTGDFRADRVFVEASRSGLISNPELLSRDVTGPSKTLELAIGEMWCPSCATVIQMVLERLDGVRSCVVDYVAEYLVCQFDPSMIASGAIGARIRRLGYVPRAQSVPPNRRLTARFGVAAFCLLNLMMLSLPVYASWDGLGGYEKVLARLSALLVVPLAWCAWPVVRRFLRSLVAGRIGMEALIVLGTASACVLSFTNLVQGGSTVYFDSVGSIITFVLLGKMLESRALRSARQVLRRKEPKRVRQEDGRWIQVQDLALGDRFVVRCGELVAADGRIVSGEGSLDEAVLSGEPNPCLRKEGDHVSAGSTLVSGFLVLAAEGWSTLSTLTDAVAGDLARRPPVLRAADAVARWVTPVVVFALGRCDSSPWLSTGNYRSTDRLPVRAWYRRAFDRDSGSGSHEPKRSAAPQQVRSVDSRQRRNRRIR